MVVVMRGDGNERRLVVKGGGSDGSGSDELY